MFQTLVCQQQYLDAKLTFQYVLLQLVCTSLLILMEKLLQLKVSDVVDIISWPRLIPTFCDEHAYMAFTSMCMWCLLCTCDVYYVHVVSTMYSHVVSTVCM